MEQGKNDKRKFFENMFKMTSIGVVKKILTDQYSTTLTNKNNITSNLQSERAVQDIILENINKISNIKDTIVEDGKISIKNYKKEMIDNDEKLLTLSNKFVEMKKKLNIKETTFDKINKRYSKLSHNLTFLNDREKYLSTNKGKKCTQCGSDITKEHTHKMMEKIVENKTSFVEKIEDIDIKTEKKLVTDYKKLIKLKETEINNIHNENKNLKNIINVTESNIKKQLNDLDLAEQQKKLEKKQAKIEMLEKSEKEVHYEITKYEFILDECLHDEGFRHFILSHYISYINNMLADNINKLNLDFELTMDNSMNIEIKKLGMNINYWGLSLGERSLLNIIILFVVVKLRKLTNTNFIDLIIIDEFLDTGLSPESIELALNLIDDLFENSSIIMISHKLSDQYDYFDNILKITKVGSFSQLDVIK